MNINVIRRAAVAVAFFVLTLTSILGTGCAAQGASKPHRRILAQADLRGRQAERMPLRIQVVGNHTSGPVKLFDGARLVTLVAPGETQMLYVNWQWREHNPRVMLGVQKPGGPIAIVPVQFFVIWQDDYVDASTPIQTEVVNIIDNGTTKDATGPPSGTGIMRLR